MKNLSGKVRAILYILIAVILAGVWVYFSFIKPYNYSIRGTVPPRYTGFYIETSDEITVGVAEPMLFNLKESDVLIYYPESDRWDSLKIELVRDFDEELEILCTNKRLFYLKFGVYTYFILVDEIFPTGTDDNVANLSLGKFFKK